MDRASSEAVILKRRKHVKHIINEYSMKMRRFRKEIHCQRNAIIKKCQIRDATPRNIFEQRLWQSKYLTPSLIKRELEYDPPSVDAQLFDLEVAESSELQSFHEQLIDELQRFMYLARRKCLFLNMSESKTKTKSL